MQKHKNIIHFITSILKPESIATINLRRKSIPFSKPMFLFIIYFSSEIDYFWWNIGCSCDYQRENIGLLNK